MFNLAETRADAQGIADDVNELLPSIVRKPALFAVALELRTQAQMLSLILSHKKHVRALNLAFPFLDGILHSMVQDTAFLLLSLEDATPNDVDALALVGEIDAAIHRLRTAFASAD